MPTTKKESLVFSMIMCFFLVFIMTIYNEILNGNIFTLPFSKQVFSFILAYTIALFLDMVLVAPIAKSIGHKVYSLTAKKIFMILTISFFMVIGMALLMSIFGLIMSMNAGAVGDTSILNLYLSTFLKNFIFALPLQLLIAGPLVRFIFSKIPFNQTTAA
ncbi:DUF2798 domain-containing protein [Salinicoccus hispanicus]|uniref:DUF2798 domain-containing protein n=1 Tax=Salinicoccus hispanicus TaxID=157225 RepID=A0A6N8U001_9STAP|nr:DUF2798 domain-containing protein [Salinicoccus hispanicus]MXQ51578.1 DUF2798 domain-containing protein [Salinicoccus hispanicus]